MRTYTQADLIQAGLDLAKKLGRLPGAADFGGENGPSWMTMFNGFGGSLDNLHDAIRMVQKRREALVKAGILLSLKLKRKIRIEDWKAANFDEKTCFQQIEVDDVIQKFGDWERFTQRVYSIPVVKLRENLERLEDIVHLVNKKVKNPITEQDIRVLSRQKNLIPHPVRGASGYALLPRSTIDLIIKIQGFYDLGLNDREIKNFLKLAAGYRDLTHASCSNCNDQLKFKSTKKIEGLLCGRCA